MENFEFFNPTHLVFGKDTVKQIGKHVRQHGCEKLLLLAGGGSIKKNGVYETVANSLNGAGINWVECWGVQPNPVISKVREAIEVAREENVDGVLAVGGGSVLDSAKALAAGFYMDDVWDAFEGTPLEKALPVFDVLTLSATGSEMNHIAVVTNADEKKKWAIKDPKIFPKVSIVDPSVQMSLPWRQTANGVMDAMSHTMEFYFMGTDEQVNLSMDEGLLRSLIGIGDRLKQDPEDYSSRANLAWAATIALNGYAGATLKGGDWATHMIEHGVSATHPNIAHAEGLAIVFPAWIDYMKDENGPTFERWAEKVWDARTTEQGVEAMRSKLDEWDQPTRLRQVGVEKDQLDHIADVVMAGRTPGNLRQLNRDDVMNILQLAY